MNGAFFSARFTGMGAWNGYGTALGFNDGGVFTFSGALGGLEEIFINREMVQW